jgi:hypothetical protein
MYHRETTDTKYSPFISLPLIETREKIFVGWTIKNLNKINALRKVHEIHVLFTFSYPFSCFVSLVMACVHKASSWTNTPLLPHQKVGQSSTQIKLDSSFENLFFNNYDIFDLLTL